MVVDSIHDCPPKRNSNDLLFPGFEECSLHLSILFLTQTSVKGVKLSHLHLTFSLPLVQFCKVDGQSLDLRLGSFFCNKWFWDFVVFYWVLFFCLFFFLMYVKPI